MNLVVSPVGSPPALLDQLGIDRDELLTRTFDNGMVVQPLVPSALLNRKSFHLPSKSLGAFPIHAGAEQVDEVSEVTRSSLVIQRHPNQRASVIQLVPSLSKR